MLHEFASTFFLIAASEFGDKTQLLVAALSVRYGRPCRILLAAFAASLVNHFASAQIGRWIGKLFSERHVSLIGAIIFAAIALVTILSRDRQSNSKDSRIERDLSFLGIFALMLLAEMGDKTQFATAALAAKYNSVVLVTLASALGTLIPDALAIYFGSALSRWMRWKYLKWLSAATFLSFAIRAALGM